MSLGATRPHPQGEIPADDTNNDANPIKDRFYKKSSKSVKMSSEKEKVVKRTASSQQDTNLTETSDHSNSLVFPSEVTRDWKARKKLTERGRDGRRKRSVILSSKTSSKDKTSRQSDTEGDDATTSSSAVSMTTISTTSVPNLAHMEKLTVSQHKQKLRVCSEFLNIRTTRRIPVMLTPIPFPLSLSPPFPLSSLPSLPLPLTSPPLPLFSPLPLPPLSPSPLPPSSFSLALFSPFPLPILFPFPLSPPLPLLPSPHPHPLSLSSPSPSLSFCYI